jgi:hypothetical protein
MKREVTTYDAALRAFRAETEAPGDGAAARARVLASAEHRVARGAAFRRVSFFGPVLLVAVASAAAAWTAAGRWRADAPRAIASGATDPSSSEIGERRGADRPARVIPAAEPVAEPASSAVGGDRESAAYARAHRAHFVEDAPARALAAWDAYLASYPAGAFAPEASYNRALCLARLGRFAEAAAALRPFARGRFGAYRREDATLLLDWLATRTHLRSAP